VRANTAPTVTSPTSFVLDHDEDLEATLTAEDKEYDPVTFEKASDPEDGEIVAFDEENGAFTYRPDAGFVGEDSFEVTVSDGFDSVTVTITLEVRATSQTLSFTQPGPVNLVVGDTLFNPANAPGTGEVTYYSDDLSIATVDDTGLVTAIAPGSVEIRAEKVADTLYFEAEAGYTLNVVSPGAEVKVPFTAWVGEDKTEVSFPAAAEGLEFYRSSAPDCDLENYNSCADGQLDILGTEPVTDTAATLSRPGYYALKDEDLIASLEVSVDHFSERRFHQVVEFKGALWLVGGRELDASFYHRMNDVWRSRDGITWTQQTGSAEFSGRQGHQVVAFKDELWVIGGRDDDGLTNDVWSSSDGIHWDQKPAAPFSARQDHQVVVHGGALWLVGGRLNSHNQYLNDVWRSENGADWEPVEQVSGATFPAREHHQVVSYDGKLWVIGGFGINALEEQNSAVWFSSDGSRWETLERSTGELFTASGHRVVEFSGQLWLFGGSADGVLSSGDGINWERHASGFPDRSGHEVVVHDGQLWLIGGEVSGIANNEVWSSPDGIAWVQQASKVFSRRAGHQVVAFEDQLWLIGGNSSGVRKNDIWSSSDAINWVYRGTAPFSPRDGHRVVVYKGDLWMIGGSTSIEYKNDVWRSADGINWEPVETEGEIFIPRSSHEVVVYGDDLWVIGGAVTHPDFQIVNDVWSSSDGIHWTKKTAAANFEARSGHQVVAYGEGMWLIAGRAGGFKRDVWFSTNGIHWEKQTSSANFDPRANHQVVVFGDKMWLIDGLGGKLRKDMWSSTNGKDWKDETGSHPFSARTRHQVVVYDGDLWVIGGADEPGFSENDVWRSSDGKDWRRGLHRRFVFR